VSGSIAPVLGVPESRRPHYRDRDLLEAAGDIKPKHIGIDTSVDVFRSNDQKSRWRLPLPPIYFLTPED
jgi:hypothetical protein